MRSVRKLADRRTLSGRSRTPLSELRPVGHAPDVSPGPAAGWDPQRQRRLTIGLGAALVGLLFAGAFLYLRTGLQTEVPQLAGKAEMERFADEMPIDELFEAWKEFVRPAELAEQVPEKVVADIKRDRRYLGLAAGGLLLLVAGLAYSGWVAFAPGRATSD